LSAQIRHFSLSVRSRATSSHQDSSEVVGINKALLDLLCNITRPLLVLVQPCLLSHLRLQLRTFCGSANLTYKPLTSLDIYSQMPPLSPFITSFRTRLLSLTSSPYDSSYHTKSTATMFPPASLPPEIICQSFSLQTTSLRSSLCLKPRHYCPTSGERIQPRFTKPLPLERSQISPTPSD
jgi:hypothetical protein